MVGTSGHDCWDLAFIARTDNTDLDQIWQAIFIGIDPAFDINDLTNSILASKGGQALTIKIVILISLRNQAVTDQLID